MAVERLANLPYHVTGHTLSETSMPYYPILPLVITPQETCPPLVPSRGEYMYPYTPSLMVSRPLETQVKVNPRVVFTHSVPVPSFENPNEQE